MIQLHWVWTSEWSPVSKWNMEVVHNNKIQPDNKIHIFGVYCLIKVLQEDNDDRIMQE